MNDQGHHSSTYGVRFLDPQFALRQPGSAPHPTVYVGGRLLLQGVSGFALTDVLTGIAAAETAYRVCSTEHDARMFDAVCRCDHVDEESVTSTWTAKLDLVEKNGDPQRAPDAWATLQRIRASKKLPEGTSVHLEHLLTPSVLESAPQWRGVSRIGGAPYWDATGGPTGVPYWDATGGPTGVPYWDAGGAPYWDASDTRIPVVWNGANPREGVTITPGRRRPVVVVPDTGVGRHPWFDLDHPERDGIREGLTYHHAAIGKLPIATADPEGTGSVLDPLGGLIDRHSGHGTFIAGLIRQGCPEADIVVLPVMNSVGAVAEGVLLEALFLLLVRHLDGLANNRPDLVIDVLSLSLGYYHEEEGDTLDAPLKGLLDQFSAAGVVVVLAAGNGSTTRRYFPAAFASTQPLADIDDGRLPMISVGAINPDGYSTASFSNEGPWVTALRPGGSVVSTIPNTFDGSRQPAVARRYADPAGRVHVRTTFDRDNFASGFCTWSGTSFSAPLFAADVAAQLVAGGGLDDVTADAHRTRGRAALRAVLERDAARQADAMNSGTHRSGTDPEAR